MSKIIAFPGIIVTPEQFEALFKPLYGFYFPLALRMFLEYGSILSFSSASVMLYAQEADKRKVCLRKMRKHFGDVISFCHPDLRQSATFLEHPAYRETTHFLKELGQEFNPVYAR